MRNEEGFKEFKVGSPEDDQQKLIMVLFDNYKKTTQLFVDENKNNSDNLVDIIIAATMSHLFHTFEFIKISIKEYSNKKEKEMIDGFQKQFKEMLEAYIKQSNLC